MGRRWKTNVVLLGRPSFSDNTTRFPIPAGIVLTDVGFPGTTDSNTEVRVTRSDNKGTQSLETWIVDGSDLVPPNVTQI